MFKNLFFKNKPSLQSTAILLYTQAVTQARRDFFYAKWGIPDTVDGRFDLIVLHLFLMQHCLLRHQDDRSTQLSQKIFDVLFWDMDQNLREMGVGDMGVPKRIKSMMLAFNGRMHAYDAAVNSGADALAAALYRNVYRENPQLPESVARPLANYCLAQIAHLRRIDVKQWHTGNVSYLNDAPLSAAA